MEYEEILGKLRKDVIEELERFSAAHTNAIYRLAKRTGRLEAFTITTAMSFAVGMLFHMAYHEKAKK